MKRTFITLTVLLIAAAFAFAQTAEIGGADPNRIGVDTAQQKLKTVSVNKFEDAGFWSSTMSTDEGFTETRQFTGGPLAKKLEPLADERYIGIDPQVADQYVIGTRVDFLRRGYNSFVIYPARPIPIEGICKIISVWVVGRNLNHTLKVLLQDFNGNDFELTMGTLNFQGWKKLEVPVPPQSPDGRNGIIQRNAHYGNRMGIKITGFKVECDPMEAYGSYYIYMDDLRAITDLFAEDNRDEDDMPDNW
jgi:hypothetical protein